MTLKQLKYFKTVADLLHFTKAAEKLYISQPSLSYGISQLEMFLGVPLFKKEGKQIFLTEYGESFYKTAQEVLSGLEAGINELNNIKKNYKNELSLGYMLTLSSTFIPELITAYKKNKKGDIQFRFTAYRPSKLLKNVISGNIDIMFSVALDSNLNSFQLSKQHISLVANKNHHLAQKKSICFEELDDAPMILRPESTYLFNSITQEFKSRNMKLNIVEETYDYYSMINYIILGKGIAFLPSAIVTGYDDLVTIPVKNLDLSRPIYMSWSKTVDENPKFKKFIQFVKENFTNIKL